MRATLQSIEPTIKGYEVTLLIERADWKPITEAEYYDVSISKYRKHKTDRQQSYYWANLRKLANELDVPMTELHNQMLLWYGTYMTEGERIVMILQADTDDYLSDESTHLEPTDETQDIEGVTYRWYRVLKPTRSMNSQEMAKLITGLDQELENVYAQ